MMQTLIPVYRAPVNTQVLSSASIASREANPTVIEPSQGLNASERPLSQSTPPSKADSAVYEDPRRQAKTAEQNTDEKNREMAEQLEVQSLSARDREVRAHERAHAAVGGQYASAPTYQYQRGPDGVNYAIGGEVQISTGAVAGDPQATIEKAQVVRRAALAPAEPSAQDRQVAAQATKMEMDALSELAITQQEERLETAKAANDDPDSSIEASEISMPASSETKAEAATLLSQSNQLINQTAFEENHNRLSNSLGQRIMSSDNVQDSLAGRLIDRLA